jgi:hypothetical protein
MQTTTNTEVGRIIRVGRGWVDVTIDHKVRRIRTRPDLLARAGCYVTIVNNQGFSLLPESPRPIVSRRFQ